MDYNYKSLSKQLRIWYVQCTINIAVAGQAGLLIRFPVVVLSAVLTVGPVGVVSAAHAAPPTAGAPVLLHVEHALVRPPTAVALCGEEGKRKARKRRGARGQVSRETWRRRKEQSQGKKWAEEEATR